MDARLMISILGAVFAFLTGGFILIRYLARQDLPFLFLGLAFVTVAFVEMVNLFFIGTAVEPPFGSAAPIEFWGLMLSGAVLCVSILVGMSIWYRRPGVHRSTSVHVSIAFVLGVTLIVLHVIGLQTLPGAVGAAGSVLQLGGFTLGLAYLLLAIFAARMSDWTYERHPIFRLIAYSLLMLGFSHLIFAQSQALTDGAFAVASILRLIAFALPFIGASHETVNLYLERDAFARRLSAQESDLARAKRIGEEESKKLRSVVDLSPSGMLIVQAPDARAIAWNRRAEELIGMLIQPTTARGNYVGTYHFENPDGGPLQESELPFHQAIELGKETSSDRVIVVHPDGARVRLTMHAVPIHDAHGKVTSVVVAFDDITERAGLEQLKTEFVSVVSHQLKSPITALSWYLEELADKRLPKHLAEPIRSIQSIARHMNDLVTNLLSASRIETGRLRLMPEVIDLCDVVHQVVDEQTSTVKEKKIKLSFACEIKKTDVFCDPKLLREVIGNYFANAVRYTPAKGSISIVIEKSGDWVRTSVIDNGIGIPESEQRSIFERFYRASNAKQHVPEGDGIGLYIVKRYIELCGGETGFTSTEGKGTTFWFTLKPAKRYHTNRVANK